MRSSPISRLTPSTALVQAIDDKRFSPQAVEPNKNRVAKSIMATQARAHAASAASTDYSTPIFIC
jgi:hypothetical protein